MTWIRFDYQVSEGITQIVSIDVGRFDMAVGGRHGIEIIGDTLRVFVFSEMGNRTDVLVLPIDDQGAAKR